MNGQLPMTERYWVLPESVIVDALQRVSDGEPVDLIMLDLDSETEVHDVPRKWWHRKKNKGRRNG